MSYSYGRNNPHRVGTYGSLWGSRNQNYGFQPTRRHAWEEKSQNEQSIQQHQQNTVDGYSSAAVTRSDQGSFGLHNQTNITAQSHPDSFGLHDQTTTTAQSHPGSFGLHDQTTTTAQSHPGSFGLHDQTTTTAQSHLGSFGLHDQTTTTAQSHPGSFGLHNQATTTAQSHPDSFGLYNQANTRDQSEPVRLGLYNQTNTNNQYRMEVDESPGSSGAVLSLTKTEELFTTLQSLSSLMPDSKREIKALKLSASAKSSVSNAELNERMEKLMLENQRLETLSKNSADVVKSLEDAVNEEKVKQEAYRKKYEAVVIDYQKEHKMVEELQETVQQQKRDIDRLSSEKDSLDRSLAVKQELYIKQSEEKRKVELELSDCKTRLSRYMGNKLSNNNPDLADLSDMNRPTKLAEMYQELYDNEWTNAYEVFEKHLKDERKTIETLLQILKDVKSHCDKLKKDQEQKVRESVFLKRTRDSNLSDNVSKPLKDFRKAIAEATLPEVLKQFIDGVQYTKYARFLTDGDVQSFFKKCVQICWLMSVQDPPVVFGEEPETLSGFDINTFRYFTTTGPLLEYMVWPALCLHEGGPVLCKGIAQGSGKQQSLSASQISREKPLAKLTTHGEPQGQIIDHHMAKNENGEKKYQRHGNANNVYAEQNQTSSNYEQLVVSDTRVDSSRNFSRTTRERDNRSVADRFDKTSSQRDGNYHSPVIPDNASFLIYCKLRRLYGEGSQEIRQGLGEKHDICADYYFHVFKK